MNIPDEVSLKCLFCGLVLETNEGIIENNKSGDQIKCNHCDELNDFDSMVRVAEEEVAELVNLEIQKSFKNIFDS
jgi:phage FluMu protein Com